MKALKRAGQLGAQRQRERADQLFALAELEEHWRDLRFDLAELADGVQAQAPHSQLAGHLLRLSCSISRLVGFLGGAPPLPALSVMPVSEDTSSARDLTPSVLQLTSPRPPRASAGPRPGAPPTECVSP